MLIARLSMLIARLFQKLHMDRIFYVLCMILLFSTLILLNKRMIKIEAEQSVSRVSFHDTTKARRLIFQTI